ncbi:hypothetical protein IMZ48_14250 [Candidatus Bathyarchaeota archaeon]|nr:hypothetical protein [Candidatus Bathyarchaeota archaeon]
MEKGEAQTFELSRLTHPLQRFKHNIYEEDRLWHLLKPIVVLNSWPASAPPQRETSSLDAPTGAVRRQRLEGEMPPFDVEWPATATRRRKHPDRLPGFRISEHGTLLWQSR